MSLQQIVDLKAEDDEFDRLPAGLREKDWSRDTQFKGWTINDIVQHLHMGDLMGLTSTTDPAGFAARLAGVQAARAKALSRVEETRQRLGNPSGASLRGVGVRRSRRCARRWRRSRATRSAPARW